MPGRVVLGVGAGIAAYKSCELLRLLTESGYRVRVVPTPDTLRFVGEATWAALSGEPVTTDVWTAVAEVPHVRLGRSADLVLIAPATADLMARAAAGMAGDLLTGTLLPARGAIVLEPAVGRLTGADSGAGRLPEPAEIFAVATRVLARRSHQARPGGNPPLDLAGRRVGGAAGGTREEIDPVRFIGNWSSGMQGYALARTAVARGAEVVVVAANVALPDPAGVKVVRVISARDMQDAVTAATAQGSGVDAVVMAAAVADYRPATRNAAKLKKDGQPPEPLALTENPDILAGLAARRAHEPGPQVLVGFAAETETDTAAGAGAAQAKLARKGCDLLVVNPVGNGLGFGTLDNEAVVYGADGTVTQVPRGPKDALADVVWDLVAARLGQDRPVL